MLRMTILGLGASLILGTADSQAQVDPDRRAEAAQDGDELTARIILTDDLDNVWETTLSIPVEPYKEPLEALIEAVHSAGTANASVTVKVIDFSALTGDAYDVYFDQQDTVNHWNLRNLSTGSVLYEDMTELGTFNNRSAPEGFVIRVDGSYDAPIDILDVDVTGSGSYDITTFTVFGFPTGWASDSYPSYGAGPAGTTDVNVLQRDLELRFTGEYDTDGLSIKDGTGSIATYIGASLYDIEDHPLNPDGSTNPFTIRIPFEIWDTEYDNGDGTFGRQVTLIVWDRHGELTAEVFYPTWNPSGRMYVWALDKPYTEDVLDPDGADAALLTWNIVFFESDWVTGDVVHISYANPIQLGVDLFTWTTAKPSSGGTISEVDIDKINVFPNPYYGFHTLEGTRADKWVKFNHLPTDKKVTIRIFNLGGVMVRSIVKAGGDGTQYAEWNLRNQAGLPVASGLYIAYIEIEDNDASKILKIAIVQESQILRVY
ncbi:MAG: hypothetical protein IIB42_04110 [Candidatus Marinimicrobia bacterium]|nr:hypothetical protein [Candidatus Neomarinimicrobiota bacterium]